MDIDTDTGLETKDGLPVESVVTHAEMMRAFEEFKQANDARSFPWKAFSVDVFLRRKSRVLTADRCHNGRRLDEIELKKARPAFGNEKPDALRRRPVARTQGGIRGLCAFRRKHQSARA